MKNLVLIFTALLCVALLSPPLPAQAQIQSLPDSPSGKFFNHPVPPWFFQMEAHWIEPFPALPAAGLRLWDTGTKWSDLNPAENVYDWTNLDKWLATAPANGKSELLYTVA